MSANMVSKLVVVGGGTAGWMAAAGLKRAFGDVLDVTLIESDSIGTVGVGEATIPVIKLFNRFLGLNEAEFMKAVQGTFKLGIEFVGWGAPGEAYMHAFGAIGQPMGLPPFWHYWLRASQTGDASSLWDYSLNTKLAYEHKFAPVEKIKNTAVDGPAYAFHFDAALYAKYLRAWCETQGVKRTEGTIVGVERDAVSGDVASLKLDDDRKVDGDFYIDCSGFRGLLIEQTLQAGYADWTDLLPCNRAIALPCSNKGPMRPYTQSIAHSAGWQWRIPLQHRTGNGHVFCSDFMSEDDAISILMSNIEGDALADPNIIRFTTGKRKTCWKHNVVAMGLASGFMEPLESTSINMVQSAIDRLVKLFPFNQDRATLAAEYNRQTDFEFETIRDFLVLHYVANKRPEPFWRMTANMQIPDSLKHKLSLFESGGRIVRQSEELFAEESWLQVLVGQGVTAAGHHPGAAMIPDAQLVRNLQNVKQAVEAASEKFPLHQDFVSKFCSQTPLC